MTETKLAFYSLFKQATQGDVTSAQPWAVQASRSPSCHPVLPLLPCASARRRSPPLTAPARPQLEARAKWDAWKKREGMSKEAAMEAYIAQVAEGDANWEDDPALAAYTEEVGRKLIA